ncbi:MAG: tetratricopeptide repeat protein [Alphaproteobacteria bacterium]|nr:tetratricopeptide repeat protein [Alphaproteobacteria bacterium]
MNGEHKNTEDLLRLAAEQFEAGDVHAAKAACDQIVASEPTHPQALNFLALIARGIKKWKKAEEIARFGCAKNPQKPQLANTLGLIMLDQRRTEEAEAEFRRAHALNPDRPEYLSNLGVTLHAMGRWEDAQEVFTKALILNADFVPALAGRAKAATDMGFYDDAQADIELAQGLDPNNLELLNSTARLALCQGDLDAAYTAFGTVVGLTPNVADARVNRGLIRMLQGRVADGWEDYGMRRARRWGRPSNRHGKLPSWGGEDLAGKRILIWSELGLGEAIMCASLIHDLAQEAEQVIFECEPRLADLFAKSFPNIEVVPEETPASKKIQKSAPDVQAPIFELIGYRGANAPAQESNSPYLLANSSNVASLKSKYVAESGGLPLVGLSWGSPKAISARQKSIAIEYWKPVLQTPGVSFVNLQYGESRGDLEDIAAQCDAVFINDQSIDTGGSLAPMADQVAALDLVITVSNTTAHISGAVGQETWVLTPPLGLGSMWFWFVDREDSPWYASVKLLRRQINTDEVFLKDVATRLRDWAAGRQ